MHFNLVQLFNELMHACMAGGVYGDEGEPDGVVEVRGGGGARDRHQPRQPGKQQIGRFGRGNTANGERLREAYDGDDELGF